MSVFRLRHGHSACIMVSSGSLFCEIADGRITGYPTFHRGSIELHPIEEFVKDSKSGLTMVRCVNHSSEPFSFPPEGITFAVNHTTAYDSLNHDVPVVHPRSTAPSPGVYMNATTRQFRIGEFKKNLRVYPVIKMPECELRFYAATQMVSTGNGDRFFYDSYGLRLRDEEGHLAPAPRTFHFTLNNFDPERVRQFQSNRSNWLNLQGLDKSTFESGLKGRTRTSTNVDDSLLEPDSESLLSASERLAHTLSSVSLSPSSDSSVDPRSEYSMYSDARNCCSTSMICSDVEPISPLANDQNSNYRENYFNTTHGPSHDFTKYEEEQFDDDTPLPGYPRTPKRSRKRRIDECNLQ